MRRLAVIPVALAFCCITTTPASAQGDGAFQQAERDRPSTPCQARRGAGPDQSLAVGTTLPKTYRGSQYEVNDWRAHNLSAPSWGAHWVQIGGDYVLVEMLTNRIRAIRLYGC